MMDFLSDMFWPIPGQDEDKPLSSRAGLWFTKASVTEAVEARHKEVQLVEREKQMREAGELEEGMISVERLRLYAETALRHVTSAQKITVRGEEIEWSDEALAKHEVRVGEPLTRLDMLFLMGQGEAGQFPLKSLFTCIVLGLTEDQKKAYDALLRQSLETKSKDDADAPSVETPTSTSTESDESAPSS